MKKKNKNEFEFCKVCNLNHDQGRRHNYFPNHTKSLSSFLSRFLKKLSDVRFFLKNPTLLRSEHASRNRLWCVFCDSDVEELDSLFACSNAINHLASSEHLKILKNFLWKHGGGMDRVDSFRVSEADLAKWEKRCKSLKSAAASSSEGFYEPSNDIHNEFNSDNMDNFEKNTVRSFKSSLSNGVLPLQCFTNERYQISHPEVSDGAKVGPLVFDATSLPVGTHDNMDFRAMHVSESAIKDLTVYRDRQHSFICNSRKGSVGLFPSNREVHQVDRMNNGESSYQVLQNFTQICSSAPEEPKGNVHSGAPPPWFEANEENQLTNQIKTGSCVDSLVSPLDKSGKSRKLNPKRVGAAWAEKRKIELEMEKRGEITNICDVDWLPNFGRVWQSGTRKESRKEFETEKEKLLMVDSLSETPIKIQPYMSKRMRRDASESIGAIGNHIDGTKNVL